MRIRKAILFLAAQIALDGTRLDAQSCRPPDAYGANMVADLRRMMTTTDARIVAARDSIYHVPVVDPSAIALVSDERSCKKALRALEHFENTSTSGPVIASTSRTMTTAPTTASRHVVVASLGRGWAVEDPGSSPGAFLTVVIFDAHWKQVGGYTGP